MDDEKREHAGTDAGAQTAEFVDTPENEPGNQEHEPDATSLGKQQPGPQ